MVLFWLAVVMMWRFETSCLLADLGLVMSMYGGFGWLVVCYCGLIVRFLLFSVIA